MSKRLTTEDFIERARKVHGNRYNYSAVKYVNGKTKVSIICSEHGFFEQLPHSHLYNHGCPICGGSPPLDTLKFIKRANEKHQNKYTYDKTTYINSNEKVCITCRIHGDFFQSPSHHMAGQGCPVCGRHKKRSTKEFMVAAKSIHGDLYNYSGVVYVNNSTPVLIRCKSHGVFMQSPGKHIAGQGCPKCLGKYQYSTSIFIEQAREIHGAKYDYTKTIYTPTHEKVTIMCPIHGAFSQPPSEHIQGAGCAKCAGRVVTKTSEFVNISKQVHGHTYIYRDTVYQSSKSKVMITCKKHGAFYQAPDMHLSGQGCPGCGVLENVNHTEPGVLYYIRVEDKTHTLWKIGITNRSVPERFAGADLEKITTLKTWRYKKLHNGHTKEREILKKYTQWSYQGIDQILQSGGNTKLFIKDVLELDKDYR